MSSRLIPRLTSEGANLRFRDLQALLGQGLDPVDLVQLDASESRPNETGGQAASLEEIRDWRAKIRETVTPIHVPSKAAHDRHGLELGRALNEFLDPIPGDAAHDGTWSFLSLYVLPDIVNERWPGSSGDEGFKLSIDRWVGAQTAGARDRNYVKTSWQRYNVLGEVMETAENPLGEDEFVALIERSALARNKRLVQAAARAVASYDQSRQRMDFTRNLMKRLCYQSGARTLDLLSDAELSAFVDKAVDHVSSAGLSKESEPTGPRRAKG